MKRIHVAAGTFVVLMMVAAPMVRADQVELNASKDNTLYEKESGDISNGEGKYMFAGRTNQSAGENLRRALVAFDLTGVIPDGSTINSVTLQLYMSRSEAGTNSVSAHRVQEDWGEGGSNAGGNEGGGDSAEPGDATWLHTDYDTVFWSTPGGVFVAFASDSTSVGGEGYYTWSSAGMIADVEYWLANPDANFGWLMLGDESEMQTAKRFDTRENNSQVQRPKLQIDFTPPADSGACCFVDSCETLSQTDCTAQGGTYQGDGTSCDDNPCGFPEGACCFANGDCVELTEGACTNAGGEYQGDGTDCSPNLCPQPTGACCFYTGLCEEETEQDCLEDGGTYLGDFTTCADDLCPIELTPFIDELPRPAVMQPVSGIPGGEATYDMAIQQVQQQLHSELPLTTVWGYAGSYPGPTLEVTTGLPITVNWINDLRDDQGELRTDHFLTVDLCPHGAIDHPKVVTHLHGGHVPFDVDGYPEFTFLPGEQEQYVYPNNQPPGTLWYHDHALGITRLNVMMGLAGFYLVRDQFEIDLNLPSGEYEIAMAIQDRKFKPDGEFSYPETLQDRFFGNIVLVNGKVWPFLNVDRGKYRFRVLNGSNSRVYRLSLSTGDPFQQIGTDGGLMAAPVTLNELLVATGERADIVIDFENYPPGTEIILTNDAPAPFPGQPGVGVIPNVMKFIVGSNTGHTDPIPSELRPFEILNEADASITREFELRKFDDPCAGAEWLINGLHWDDITELVDLGDTEVWSFINRSGIAHPMHMHLVFFQVLDRQPFEVIDGEIVPIGDPVPPAPNEAGWKDTVEVYPFEITRVIARFEDYTGLYAYHCHILEHEDHEMMRQFEVVDTCPWDLGNDGVVDAADLAQLLGAWGANPGHPADFNDDGVVDAADLAAMLGAWGPCP